MVFAVGSAWVAAPAERTREVFAAPRPTRVPWAPRWLPGIVRRQGRIITLVDLARFLGVTADGPPETAVVLDRDDVPLALLATSAELTDARAAESCARPDSALGRSPLMRSACRLDDRVLLALDLDRVVTALLESA